MQVVFIKPLIEVALGFNTKFNPYERYQIEETTISKISDYLYDVPSNKIDVLIEDILDLVDIAKCVPAYIDTEENCEDFINQALAALKDVKPTDLLWIKPDTFTMNNKKYFCKANGYVSGTALLRNGRTFLVGKVVKGNKESGVASDYRVFSQMIFGMTKEEMCTDNAVKNIAGVITKIIKYATEVTIEEILYNKFGSDLFNNDESIGFRIGSTVDIFHNWDNVVEKIIPIVFEDRDIFDHCEILARFTGKFSYGVWQEDNEHEYDFTTPNKSINTLTQMGGEVLTLRKVR